VYLLRTDLSGNVIWEKSYGGTGADGGLSAIQTSDGGYAITGWTNSFGFSDPNSAIYIIKTDSNGNMQWNKTYGGHWDAGCSIVQTYEGGYAIGGFTHTAPHKSEAYLIKIDSSGNLQWNQTFGDSGTEAAYSIIQTSDHGFALVGSASNHAFLVKADSNGNMQWNQSYSGLGSAVGNAVVQTTDGGYALTGLTYATDQSNSSFFLIKTNSVGNVQWSQNFGGGGYYCAYSLAQTSDSGYAIAGVFNTEVNGANDTTYLVKTDSGGNLQWSKAYAGTGNYDGLYIIQAADGGFVVTGYANSPGNQRAYLIKTDSFGNIQ
jgi:hypothetical protein